MKNVDWFSCKLTPFSNGRVTLNVISSHLMLTALPAEKQFLRRLVFPKAMDKERLSSRSPAIYLALLRYEFSCQPPVAWRIVRR